MSKISDSDVSKGDNQEKREGYFQRAFPDKLDEDAGKFRFPDSPLEIQQMIISCLRKIGSFYGQAMLFHEAGTWFNIAYEQQLIAIDAFKNHLKVGTLFSMISTAFFELEKHEDANKYFKLTFHFLDSLSDEEKPKTAADKSIYEKILVQSKQIFDINSQRLNKNGLAVETLQESAADQDIAELGLSGLVTGSV